MAHLTVPFRVRLFFVRHGESQMNTAAHLLGKADDREGQQGMGA
jgi:broad specificity phosphatase PhoE